MLTTEFDRVRLVQRETCRNGEAWSFEVIQSGRIWCVTRRFEVDGSWRDRIRAKSNRDYAPHPTSDTAKAITRMVSRYIDTEEAINE